MHYDTLRITLDPKHHYRLQSGGGQGHADDETHAKHEYSGIQETPCVILKEISSPNCSIYIRILKLVSCIY